MKIIKKNWHTASILSLFYLATCQMCAIHFDDNRASLVGGNLT